MEVTWFQTGDVAKLMDSAGIDEENIPESFLENGLNKNTLSKVIRISVMDRENTQCLAFKDARGCLVERTLELSLEASRYKALLRSTTSPSLPTSVKKCSFALP